MTGVSKVHWGRVALGVVFGSAMYVWTADVRSVYSLLWAIACGIVAVYVLGHLFPVSRRYIPGADNRKGASDSGHTADLPESSSKRLVMARVTYAGAVLIILIQAVRSFYLVGNWTELPNPKEGVIWVLIVGASITIWLVFRRRALRAVQQREGSRPGSRHSVQRNVFENYLVSWAGAIGVATAGMTAEFAGAGLLMTISATISGVCMATTYPSSSSIG